MAQSSNEKTMEDVPLRPVGNMERFNIVRNYLHFYNNVQVSGTYTIPSSLLSNFSSSTKSNRLQSLIYAGTQETLNQHPVMSVVIEDESTSKPKWRRLKTIDLDEVVKFIPGDPNASSDSWVEDAHRERLDRCDILPLWRVIVVAQDYPKEGTETKDGPVQFSLGFFAHHAIVDGISAAAFHRTFLDVLNDYIANNTQRSLAEAETSLVPAPRLPLIPTLEEEGSFGVQILFALKQAIKALIYSRVDPFNWSGPVSDPALPRPPLCNIRSFLLPTPLTNAVLAKCRNEKTTLTSLITVLMSRKLAVMYPDYKRFMGNIPFSVRKFTKRTQLDMGFFVTTIEPAFSSESKTPPGYISCFTPSSPSESDDLLWESCRIVRKYVTENTKSPDNQLVGMAKFIPDMEKMFMGSLGKKRSRAFEVTNLGVVDGGLGEDGKGSQGKASFDRLKFSASLATSGNPYVVSIVSTKNGYMDITMTWETGVVSGDEAGKMLGWIEAELKRLGGE